MEFQIQRFFPSSMKIGKIKSLGVSVVSATRLLIAGLVLKIRYLFCKYIFIIFYLLHLDFYENDKQQIRIFHHRQFHKQSYRGNIFKATERMVLFSDTKEK